MIEKRAKSESMTQTAVIVNWLWAASSPTVIQAPQVSPDETSPAVKKAMVRFKKRLAQVEEDKALGRTPENLSLADNRDSYARPTHAPGCKCLMCQGK
jgi:hypothetical protein